MPSIARAGKKGLPRSKTDYYATKQEAADGHVKAVDTLFDITHTKQEILDVGFGSGIYGYSIRKELPLAYLHGIDVDSSRLSGTYPYSYLYVGDFLIFSPRTEYDLIIGNPPYYKLQEFFEYSLGLISNSGIVSFLVKNSYLESEIRFGFFKKHKPVSVLQCVTRPIKGHAESYCIVNYKKTPADFTILGWLHSTKKNYELVI